MIADAAWSRPSRLPPGWRLAHLHLVSRRVAAAAAAMAGCALLLWIALHRPWDAYGALQLPLIFEAGCANVIAVTAAGPFGEVERTTGRRLPLLRLGVALGLTAAAVGALSSAGIGTNLAGGALQVLRNTAGLTGLGLLGAALVGGALAWTGPTTYLMVAVYALYTQWHGPALTTPWIWPARPSSDAGAALCAGAVFAAGLLAFAVRGSRDRTRG
jgi:hypothetical protein